MNNIPEVWLVWSCAQDYDESDELMGVFANEDAANEHALHLIEEGIDAKVESNIVRSNAPQRVTIYTASFSLKLYQQIAQNEDFAHLNLKPGDHLMVNSYTFNDDEVPSWYDTVTEDATLTFYPDGLSFKVDGLNEKAVRTMCRENAQLLVDKGAKA